MRSSSASPWIASCRRALSSEASSSELGLVERTRRTQRETWSGSIRIPPRAPTCSIADWVRLPTILCVEVSTASAPAATGDSGSVG